MSVANWWSRHPHDIVGEEKMDLDNTKWRPYVYFSVRDSANSINWKWKTCHPNEISQDTPRKMRRIRYDIRNMGQLESKWLTRWLPMTIWPFFMMSSTERGPYRTLQTWVCKSFAGWRFSCEFFCRLVSVFSNYYWGCILCILALLCCVFFAG